MIIPITAILRHLDITLPTGTRADLDRILRAWVGRIPWESASRIARHQQPGSAADYARGPDIFFADALRLGTGGTCFESNLALHTLLTALGYTCTLAFCDMQEGDTLQINPHSAVIVTVDRVRYMADAGYPVPLALRLDENTTSRATNIYQYDLVPDGSERWAVNQGSGDFQRTCFWLKGTPIPYDEFWARLVRDHEAGGFFLSEVIITRQVDDDTIWRYNEGKGLVQRTYGREEVIPLTTKQGTDLPGTLSESFEMDRRVIAAALDRQPAVGVWSGGV
ncbi:arylamine N-acetyltransferase [Chloroflexota bacterium]